MVGMITADGFLDEAAGYMGHWKRETHNVIESVRVCATDRSRADHKWYVGAYLTIVAHPAAEEFNALVRDSGAAKSAK